MMQSNREIRFFDSHQIQQQRRRKVFTIMFSGLIVMALFLYFSSQGNPDDSSYTYDGETDNIDYIPTEKPLNETVSSEPSIPKSLPPKESPVLPTLLPHNDNSSTEHNSTNHTPTKTLVPNKPKNPKNPNNNNNNNNKNNNNNENNGKNENNNNNNNNDNNNNNKNNNNNENNGKNENNNNNNNNNNNTSENSNDNSNENNNNNNNNNTHKNNNNNNDNQDNNDKNENNNVCSQWVLYSIQHSGTHYVVDMMRNSPHYSTARNEFFYQNHEAEQNKENSTAIHQILTNNLKQDSFILQYGQAEEYPIVWDYIRHNNIKIIHLVRNPFDSALSSVLQDGTGLNGHCHEGKDCPQAEGHPIRPEFFFREYVKKTFQLKSEARFLNDSASQLPPHLEFIYEEVIAHPIEQFTRLFNFLNCPIPSDLHSNLVKTHVKSVSEEVPNWSDVVHAYLERPAELRRLSAIERENLRKSFHETSPDLVPLN